MQQSFSAAAPLDTSDTQTRKSEGHRPNSEDKTAEWFRAINQLDKLEGILTKPREAYAFRRSSLIFSPIAVSSCIVTPSLFSILY
jgi:hypothetical protein